MQKAAATAAKDPATAEAVDQTAVSKTADLVAGAISTVNSFTAAATSLEVWPSCYGHPVCELIIYFPVLVKFILLWHYTDI